MAGIKGDRRVMSDIEKIRSHEWAKVIEGEKNAKTK